jgi:general secretion pathway protein E
MSAAPEIVSGAALDEVTLARVMAEARTSGRAPYELLEQSLGLDSAALTAGLAAAFEYRLLFGARELNTMQPAFDILPSAEAAKRRCVVVREEGRLLAVISDPFDASLRPWLEARVPGTLEWAMVPRADISAFIARHEQTLRAMDSAINVEQPDTDAEGGFENLSLASISLDSSPIVKLVHSTLFDALRAGASDIHLETRASGLVIRYRIDGVLLQIATVGGAETSEQVISRIKVMSELDIAERRVPQDGRFKVAIDGRPIDFRVSIIPSVFGEDGVLRILDKQSITDQMNGLRLDGLGFDGAIIAALRRLSAQPYGMLLVTGPTGSGKTTTLYAAISETNSGSDKIVTIEDPVEYQLPGVLQIPVNEKKGLTFAKGLRSILRHDPDKIMVGEIRDPETAQIAIQSALTGHLVFTTVHANSVFDVLSRFVHMGVDAYSFVSALNGILAQRLIRINCTQCSESQAPAAELLRESGIEPADYRSFEFRFGRGCAHCRGSGYRGRRAIGEILVLNDELREAIVNRAPVRQLKEMAVKAGVRFIRNAAIDLVRSGETTIEEINRVTALA